MFGVTRPNLRTLVQSIARHDSLFPSISPFRAAQTFIRRSQTYNETRHHDVAEGGDYIIQTAQHQGKDFNVQINTYHRSISLQLKEKPEKISGKTTQLEMRN